MPLRCESSLPLASSSCIPALWSTAGQCATGLRLKVSAGFTCGRLAGCSLSATNGTDSGIHRLPLRRQRFGRGVLAVVPAGFLDASQVSAGQAGAMDLPLSEEEEDGSLQPVDALCKALLVDFSVKVASYISRYDPVTSPVEAAPFAPVSEALASATAWIAAEEGERLAFYSAAASDRPYRSSGAKEKTGPEGQEAHHGPAGRADWQFGRPDSGTDPGSGPLCETDWKAAAF